MALRVPEEPREGQEGLVGLEEQEGLAARGLEVNEEKEDLQDLL